MILKQDMRPKVLASCFASAAVKNVAPQLITPALFGAGPAAAGDEFWAGRLRAACWTALHLAADICPVHESAGGPPDALERPVRMSPVMAAAPAMTGIMANFPARPKESLGRAAWRLVREPCSDRSARRLRIGLNRRRNGIGPPWHKSVDSEVAMGPSHTTLARPRPPYRSPSHAFKTETRLVCTMTVWG